MSYACVRVLALVVRVMRPSPCALVSRRVLVRSDWAYARSCAFDPSVRALARAWVRSAAFDILEPVFVDNIIQEHGQGPRSLRPRLSLSLSRCRRSEEHI